MGVALREASAAVDALFTLADRVSGLSIGALCKDGPLEALTRTDVAQTAVVVTSMAASLHLDPSQVKANVLAGAQYLRLMLSRYGSTELALAAYNAGPTAVDRAAGAPTVETIAYVTNVEQRMTSLTGCV